MGPEGVVDSGIHSVLSPQSSVLNTKSSVLKRYARCARASGAPQGVRDRGRWASACSWPAQLGQMRAIPLAKLHGSRLAMLVAQRTQLCTRQIDEERADSRRRVDWRLRANAMVCGSRGGDGGF